MARLQDDAGWGGAMDSVVGFVCAKAKEARGVLITAGGGARTTHLDQPQHSERAQNLDPREIAAALPVVIAARAADNGQDIEPRDAHRQDVERKPALRDDGTQRR